MNIYISHYLSNESLCALLICASILATIIILNSSQNLSRQFCALGLITGLALLTKFTTLTILPVIFLILLYKLLSEEKSPFVKLARYFSLMLLPIVAVAGWFYVRNWIHFGKPLVGNWDPLLGFDWWQDPGFHTYRYFCQFGKVFCLPYFAGFYSFFDSIYSTFWGDGQLGGQAMYSNRPPWNYEYMSSVYLLSVPATLAIIIGTFRAISKAVLGANKFWLLILGSLFVVIFSIVYINLQIPLYAQAKAFYGLCAVMPISLIFAFGFDYVDGWLRDKNLFLLRGILYGWLGTLVLAIFFSFLVRPAQMQTPLNLLALAREGKLDQAFAHYRHSLHNDSNDYNAHRNLAFAYTLQGKYNDAVEHYEKTLQLKRDWPEVLNNLALLLANKPDATDSDRLQSVRYAKRSCELTGYLQAKMLYTLADAYGASGKSSDAIKTAEKAINLANAEGKKKLAEKIRERLQFYKEAGE